MFAFEFLNNKTVTYCTRSIVYDADIFNGDIIRKFIFNCNVLIFIKRFKWFLLPGLERQTCCFERLGLIGKTHIKKPATLFRTQSVAGARFL
jgi:hypothetical protein